MRAHNATALRCQIISPRHFCVPQVHCKTRAACKQQARRAVSYRLGRITDIMSLTSAADTNSATLIPQLPAELVLMVVCECPIASLGAVLSISREWSAVAANDSFWLALVRRRWPQLTLSSTCPRLRSGREAFVCLCEVQWPGDSSWERSRVLAWPPGAVHNLRALKSAPAHRFLQGLSHGFMPTTDGCFTYHEAGATPVHYRWVRHNASGWPEAGRWEWSPDRVEWFATHTTMLSRGVFAQGGEWELTGPNEEVRT